MTAVDWTRFFDDYALAARSGDPGRVAAFYADAFVAAGPRGSGSFRNDAAFLVWLEGVDAFNRRTGMQALRVASVDARPLGRAHACVTVEWSARFQRLDEQDVRFRITYVVEQVGEPRILLYVTHEDQEEEMRRLGLV